MHLKSNTANIAIHHLYDYTSRAAGKQESIPAAIKWEAGFAILSRSLIYHRANTQRQTAIHMHVHTYTDSKLHRKKPQLVQTQSHIFLLLM